MQLPPDHYVVSEWMPVPGETHIYIGLDLATREDICRIFRVSPEQLGLSIKDRAGEL